MGKKLGGSTPGLDAVVKKKSLSWMEIEILPSNLLLQ
jgi:hypothetical protein